MAEVNLYGAKTTSFFNATTYFPTIGQGWFDTTNGGSTEGNYSRAQQIAGVLSNLYLTIASPNGITATSTLTSRVGAAPGNQIISVGSGAFGEFEDTSDHDTLAASNLVNYRLVTGSTGTSFEPGTVGTRFAATANTTVTYTAHSTNPATTASTTFYFNFCGHQSTQTSDSAAYQAKSRVAGTWANYGLCIGSNTRTSTTTYKNRLNAADGSMILSLISGINVSGQITDTIHNDPVVVGSLMNSDCANGTGGGVIGCDSFYDITTVNSTAHYANCNRQGGVALPANTTRYEFVQGGAANDNGVVVESLTQQKAGVGCVASEYEVYVTTNTVSATSTVTFRKNGSNAAGVISIGASTANSWFEDTSDSDPLLATDEINWQATMGATGTSLIIVQTGLLESFPTGSLFFPANLATGAGGPFFSNPVT